MSKLMEQVKALQDEAHTCPKCGGDGVLYGQMGYNGCATEYTCYRCNSTKRVPNPGVDTLVGVIEVLVKNTIDPCDTCSACLGRYPCHELVQHLTVTALLDYGLPDVERAIAVMEAEHEQAT